MSEKPQHSLDVDHGEQTPADILKEILDRATPQIPDPPEEDSQEKAAVQEEPAPEAEDQSPPPEKNKKSSAYVYLAVLFGAAFLMLLLAYFVQQRNNAAAIDDLRSINTASRQELLEDIQRLEKENEALQQGNKQLDSQLAQIKEERESLKSQLDEFYTSLGQASIRTALNNELYYLEQFIDSKDWLMAGVTIESADHYYNEHNVEYSPPTFPLMASQTVRYLELKEEVFKKSGVMVNEQFFASEDENDYTERPHIGENIFDEQDYYTAKSLLTVILYYPNYLDIPAGFLHEYFRQTDSSLERLNSGAFKPSTVELYQQVRADILAAEALIELNGELTGIPKFIQ